MRRRANTFAHLSATMGDVRIRHSSHDFGWQSSHSVDLAGWQAKMASKFGYYDVMRTRPIQWPITRFFFLFEAIADDYSVNIIDFEHCWKV